MNGVVERLRGWVSTRWNGPEQFSTVLSKPLPLNVSWIHTLGSLLLVYILFQMLTGILLSFYYSASPESAYDSVRYIREELFLGWLIHRLHKYGASFVIVTAFVHMARSYFLASYKAPRELLWLTGLAMGVLLTLFAFTGQLLPYDQHGYWATVVGIRIASAAPGLSDVIRELLTGGYGNIGATTLSRFHILHVCVLPLTFAALIPLHLSILQKTGSAGPVSGLAGPTRPFFPFQVVKDVLVAAGGTLLLFLIAALLSYEDSGPANPAPGDFKPRPEWYFLAHFELMRFTEGNWQILGTFVAPNVLLGILALLPFVDRGPERSPRKRKFATGAGIVLCVALVGLTAKGIASGREPGGGDGGAHAALGPIARGKVLFHEKKCVTCHTIEGEGGGNKGPELTHVARRIRPDYFREWIRNPRNFDPTTEMPSFEGTNEELETLVEYLLTLQ